MTIKIKPLPMEAAEEFWRDKVLLSPGQFSKLSDQAKTIAFSVSGIARGDELTTVFNAMQKAISNGIPFDAFKEECAEIFQRRGWTGKFAWRVDNLFRTNIQTAYNVGRYNEMQQVKASRPYWQYSAVNDSRTRPTHLAVDGVVYPADHAFWDTWYPPNGFRCRCGVITLSERELKRDGLKVEKKDLTGRLVEPKNPAGGGKLPARLLMPDPGFSHHPGKTVYAGIVDSVSQGGFSTMPDLKGPADYRLAAMRNISAKNIADFHTESILPAGLADAEYIKKFTKQYGKETVIRDAAGEPVILSLRAFLKDKTPGAKPDWKFSKAGHGESIPLLADMIKNPHEIWLTPQQNKAGRIRLTKRYICLWKTDDKKRIGGLAVYEVSGGAFHSVTSFLPAKKSGLPDTEYVERQRRGLLLYRRKKGESGTGL